VLDALLEIADVREALETLDPTDFFPALHEYKGDDFFKQARFRADRSQYSLCAAASRTGKTYGAADQFTARIAEDLCVLPWEDEKLYWCVAPTHQLNAAQAKQLKRLIPDFMIDWERMYRRAKLHENWGARFGDGQGGVLYLIGNITIELRSAANPESLVAEKVRGIWITEIARIKWSAWSNIVERLSNYSDSWLIGDTTPVGHNWFYREVWEKAERGEFVGASIHHWTAYDSPYVAPEKIEAAKVNLSPEFFARGFLASFGAFYGKIYTAWTDSEKHVVNGCPFRPKKVIVSADLNANTERPAAFGEFLVGGKYVDPSREEWDRMHLAREFYRPIGLDYETYADEIAASVRRWRMAGYTEETGTLEVIIDPSAHNAFKKMLRDRGVTPHNANNDVKQGIMTFGGAMVIKGDAPIFTIDKRCKNFPREVNGYSWKVNANGVALEEPDKTLDDHLLDCGRYAAMRVWNRSGKGGRARHVA
jgi:hypothetical protein